MADYPAGLPLPTIDGYGLEPVDATIRTNMETGSAKVRRRTTAPPEMYPVAFVYSDAQMATFKTFFDSTLFNGSSWFNVSLADAKGGLHTRVARFVGPYKAKLLTGLIWSVSGQLEVKYA